MSWDKNPPEGAAWAPKGEAVVGFWPKIPAEVAAVVGAAPNNELPGAFVCPTEPPNTETKIETPVRPTHC